ncbi:MAG TPA: hypothetical protein VF136_10735 [Methylomirabilota bacterium]
MRYLAVLALALGALTLPGLGSGPAAAADLRAHGKSVLPPTGPPPARTPSVLRGGDPGIERFDGHRRGHRRPHRPGHQRPVLVVPQTVFVTPSQCWQPGYWTYQWVPQTYTYSTWVAGRWSPDGYWVDGHYAPSQVSSGYYHPLWVEGYYRAC